MASIRGQTSPLYCNEKRKPNTFFTLIQDKSEVGCHGVDATGPVGPVGLLSVVIGEDGERTVVKQAQETLYRNHGARVAEHERSLRVGATRTF